jgi:hypothetical protein
MNAKRSAMIVGVVMPFRTAANDAVFSANIKPLAIGEAHKHDALE